MRASILGVFAVVAFAHAAPAGAHHSISRHYHRNQSVTVQGVVTYLLFRNPHVLVQVDVRNEAGDTEAWTLEWDDAGDLVEVGIAADTIRRGDLVVVAGNPSRDGSNSLFIRELRRPADGLVYIDD